ncbi:MAG TPA: translation elongation factor 4 [bacterium]|uniref:Elongation factor 4 n=1 Tax=candidate division TA06 bacterium ADurb.Bin417 TaxID=1852828 RepID=A0A1V5MIN4_UNCT6|nr:MAG: Elongation factor 4 [candidate division TA06 bacterium ADurb.Bin417]HNQ35059.1 translation elongation factor 4 [bacterium]HNS48428.1 translation elongation factor 4 [bacterium]
MHKNGISHTRNFAIVAHVDHGKSTLADRFLQLCGAVEERNFRNQLLDSLDLEREHGITIRSHPVTLDYRGYRLNLIDTPGHIDFSYEVEKSLAATNGVILLVDATQGVQAQTVANLQLAQRLDLEIIPAVNKIDLPNSQVEETRRELMEILPVFENEIILVSAKTGQGVPELLQTVIDQVPAPSSPAGGHLSALVFDARYNPYLGLDLYVVIRSGRVKKGDRLRLLGLGLEAEALAIGIFRPEPSETGLLEPGQVGYVTINIKDFSREFVGDTLARLEEPSPQPLPGYRRLKQFVFCGLYPGDGEEFPRLKDSIERLHLSDPSFTFSEERSAALGVGFRAGFLGMLHMSITQERLEREFGVKVVRTTPNTTYRFQLRDGTEREVRSASELPEWSQVREVLEPFLKVLIIAPADYYGEVTGLCQGYRADQKKVEFLGSNLVLFTYEMPLSEMMVDFYDRLQSLTRGYGSLDYEFIDYRPSDLVKLDILINGKALDVLTTVVHREKSRKMAQDLLAKLRKNIPRHLFAVVIQAAVDGKIIGRQEVAPFKKAVTSKCYGGDITRKRKLWEKQKEGKKRMKMVGQVQIPESAFLALYK